jgi:hypothetical protein
MASPQEKAQRVLWYAESKVSGDFRGGGYRKMLEPVSVFVSGINISKKPTVS